MEMDREDGGRRSALSGVTAIRLPWPTVMILLAGIFLILRFA
jgi:hypothetical protein